MRVRDALVAGLVLGIGMSLTSFSLTEKITAFATVIAVTSIIFRKKVLTGPFGGLLTGIATGIGFGSLLFGM